MGKKQIKFCDYIQSIKKDFVKGDTFLFVRFDMKDLNLIRSIQKKKVFVFEISENIWEEVEWDITDEDKIYPISVFEILKLLK